MIEMRSYLGVSFRLNACGATGWLLLIILMQFMCRNIGLITSVCCWGGKIWGNNNIHVEKGCSL